MKRRLRRFPRGLLVVLGFSDRGAADPASRPGELLVGGQSRVLIGDVARSTAEIPAVVWAWDASRNLFARHTGRFFRTFQQQTIL